MTHTGANHQPQSTPLEPPSPLSPNPISAFLPPGISNDDPLAFASRLAQLYSDPGVTRNGQYPTVEKDTMP